jgi:AcrR family transcriptional regulator
MLLRPGSLEETISVLSARWPRPNGFQRNGELTFRMSKHDSDEPAPGRSPRLDRAVSERLEAAGARAELRAERFLAAAREVIEEKNSTDFTIQQVVERSGQSLRGFYHYFNGKDALISSLFEESIQEAAADIREAVEGESESLARLRAFTIRFHEWCERNDGPPKRGEHNRMPVTEFSWMLSMRDPKRVGTIMAPISKMLIELIEAAAKAGTIQTLDSHQAAILRQQTVMYSWLLTRVVDDPKYRVSAEETWDFCLRGLHG